ncbi:MAG: hypothetical protein GPJ54_01625 [Candidatus Heimdallarchaeota archaeon]|nr:hypothetical protein [Candidatus Heimdallarchaeota archaeon]
MDREKLIDLINSNGGYRSKKLPYNCPFDKLELEGILQYGSPGAFDRQEFSDQVVYYSDKKSKLHVSHQTIDYTPVQRDLNTVRGLGISLSVIRQDPRERRLITRRKNILEILERLPEKFRSVAKTIKLNDLEGLTELCLSYKKPNVQRLVLLLVTQRANVNGIYVSRSDLPNYFGIKINGLKLLEELRESGMFDGNVSESVEVEANNILFNFRNKGHLSKRQLMFAQTRVSEFKTMYPEVFTARKNLGVVVALMSIRLTRNVKLTHLLKEHAEIYELDKMIRRNNYLAVKRAEERSDVYLNELKNNEKVNLYNFNQ